MRIKLLVLVLSVLIAGCTADTARSTSAEGTSAGTGTQPESGKIIQDAALIRSDDVQNNHSDFSGNHAGNDAYSDNDENNEKYEIDESIIAEDGTEDNAADGAENSSDKSVNDETGEKEIVEEKEDNIELSPVIPQKPVIPERGDSTDDIQSGLESAELLNAAGLDNFYRVSNDIYRSAQPTPEGLISASQMGIKTVLSLQLINLDTALEGAAESGLNFEHVSMVPWDISESNLLDALRVIRDASKPILVHCLHGSDRTGLVVALYRVLFQGWMLDAARDEMLNGGFGYHSEFGNIPETLDSVDIEKLSAALFGEED